MKDLIEALQILLAYGDEHYPTYCNSEVMQITGIDPAVVSEADRQRLAELSFDVTGEHGISMFASNRFGG